MAEDNPKSFQDFLKKARENSKRQIEEDMKIFDVSFLDKDIKAQLRKVVAFEKIINKIAVHYGKNDFGIIRDSLNMFYQNRAFYVNLAYLRKQQRANRIMFALTSIIFVLMLIQLYFYYCNGCR